MKTPLYDVHTALGARMVDFAGWDLPIQYTGILKEHQHTRTETSLFDICHMGEFLINGAQAAADLERLLTCAVGSLAVGQCRYGFLLNEQGGVLDDLTVYRKSETAFMLVVNAATRERDAAWIGEHLSDDTVFSDISDQTGKLDIQGPTSRECLAEALDLDVPSLKFFRFTELELHGHPCLLSRTGYTGEWGYELYCPWEATAMFWEKVLLHPRIEPAGLGARDTLRLEVGYPLYGHELTEDRTPVGATRGLFMAMDKEFIGQPAVVAELKQGAPMELVGVRLEGRRAARPGDTLWQQDTQVGEVTSGSLAPSLNCAVATAYVQPSAAQPGTALEVEVRGTRLTATVCDMPFYKHGTARKKEARTS